MISVAPDKLLGTFRIGDTYVRVFTNKKAWGGQVILLPDDKGLPIINIGLASSNWADAIAVLLHEVFELLMHQHRLALEPTANGWSRASSRYVFHMTHEEFNEVTERASSPLSEILSKLSVVFQKVHHPRTTKRRKR